MKTYQDLQDVGPVEKDRMKFIQAVIRDHQSSAVFRMAQIAQRYYRGENVTIMNYQKLIYDAFGRAVPDIWSPNHKIPCHMYKYLVNQCAVTLLGNGVSFTQKATKDKLGKGFDGMVLRALIDALNGAVSYAFVEDDQITRFTVREFAALKDENTSAIRAGVRFWRLDTTKPLRATLYEENGFTEYIQRRGQPMELLQKKRSYVIVKQSSDVDGEEEIVEERNYAGFPIVPLYNVEHMSELENNRELHDALDLVLSGLINNTDAGEIIYWLCKNSQAMDQPSLNRLLQTLKTAHIASVEESDDIQAHSVTVNVTASKESIEQLRQQIFDNHMGLDVRNIASGAATATQIKAAYEPNDTKIALLEPQVTDFIQGILALRGIDDDPTYTPSRIINQAEMVNTIVAAGDNLSREYKTRKILDYLGDQDKADEVLKQLDAEESARYKTEDGGDDEDENGGGSNPVTGFVGSTPEGSGAAE